MDLSETRNLDSIGARHLRAARLLMDGADLIDRVGWCQNNYATEEGQLCFLGAVKKAAGLDAFEDESLEVDDAAELMFAHLGEVAWKWQDKPLRTKEQVVGAMREAARPFL